MVISNLVITIPQRNVYMLLDTMTQISFSLKKLLDRFTLVTHLIKDDFRNYYKKKPVTYLTITFSLGMDDVKSL